MPETPLPRLFVDMPLTNSGEITLNRDQSHYLVNVMRRPAESQLFLLNGHDGEWQTTILDANKKACRIQLDQQTRIQSPEPDVWLLFAPLKKDRTDFVVEKATELGVSRIIPVLTARTQTTRVNVDRLQATAREAAEQSQRLSIPEVTEPLAIKDIHTAWPHGRTLIYLDETGAGRPLAATLEAIIETPLAFVTGPEGGFAAGELDALDKLPFSVAADLGPRILRAETAVTAALAIRQGIADLKEHIASSPSSA
jgi:16S rRNA (uracil1498-N3)-methyltransferase